MVKEHLWHTGHRGNWVRRANHAGSQIPSAQRLHLYLCVQKGLTLNTGAHGLKQRVRNSLITVRWGHEKRQEHTALIRIC